MIAATAELRVGIDPVIAMSAPRLIYLVHRVQIIALCVSMDISIVCKLHCTQMSSIALHIAYIHGCKCVYSSRPLSPERSCGDFCFQNAYEHMSYK